VNTVSPLDSIDSLLPDQKTRKIRQQFMQFFENLFDKRIYPGYYN